MANYYESLTHQYAISKTLRNELIPIGKTLENIKTSELLSKDEERGENYKKVKLLLDNYHKNFINSTLKDYKISTLDDAAKAYFERDKINEKDLDEKFGKARKEIAELFKKANSAELGKNEWIEKILPDMLTDKEDLEAVESFRGFTTYFTGYNTIRQNLYSEDKKSSSIAYRLIDENLPRFLDNIKIYEQVKKSGIDLYGITEKIGIHECDSLFGVDGYNDCLVQANIDLYNELIGEINKQINLLNQKMHADPEYHKIGKMKVLYKQLLSDREAIFTIDEFTNDIEVIKALTEFSDYIECFLNGEGIKNFATALLECNGAGVFVKNDTSLTFLAVILGEQWNYFKNAISIEYDRKYSGKKTGEKYEVEKEKILKSVKSYSIQHLAEIVEKEDIVSSYNAYVCNLSGICSAKLKEMMQALEEHNTDRKFSKNLKLVDSVKEFLDSVKEIERTLKLFQGTGLESDRNEILYGEWTQLIDEIRTVDGIYNMVRNYVTQKPFSTEKIKLNFNCPTFLNGWDKNKESANLGVILERNGFYYLGIMNTNSRQIFSKIPVSVTNDVYRKMEYKLLPGPNKMLPKVFFAKSKIDYYKPSAEIMRIYDSGSFKKGGEKEFNLKDCHTLIDFYKSSISIHPDWSKFGFEFSDTESYADISAFFREVEQQGYKISFMDIDASYIDELINENKLFLFRIHNKDFSEKSHGNYNLHTIYWKMLFDERNLVNAVYKLNGEAEVFYRPLSINAEDMIVHEAGKPIKKKQHPGEEKTFGYDIIKDKRYTEDKFLLHVPITMNFGDRLKEKFNIGINKLIQSNTDVCVIGIDRGERNLLYAVVVNKDGHILDQISLNSIGNFGDITVDYHELLDEKEKERMAARKNWQTIESIKELKEGYMSQVVHKLAELVLKYNAIIVLEDLNMGFKQGRGGKVEKSVYQKFEKMLIDKFNYLVMDKTREQNNPLCIGNALNALQLTAPFDGFNNMGKQTGIIYYVPAYLTSKIDPTTGFANLFYAKYENISKARKFFESFDSISFNPKTDYFEFKFDYSKFTFKAEGSKTKWTVCSVGKRIEKFRDADNNNMWSDRIVFPTEMLGKLLCEYGIEYKSGNNIIQDISNMESSPSAKQFYEKLLHIFNLIVQLRNSTSDGKEDFIQSPVCNKDGYFYNSSECDESLPKDADANGAYNIARKGLWVLNEIRNAEDLSKVKIAMTNKEWLRYAQHE